MTSLGVGGVGQSAAQYLQQLTGQQGASGGAKGGHHRHHGIGGGAAGGAAGAGGQQQVSSLLDTIASALQSADPSADPNQVIEDTVTKLLQSGTTGANGAASTSLGTVQAAGTQASNQQSFVQLLQAHGVNLQQFQSDLLTAVKDAQNGKVNPATALQSLPPGSALNLTA
jgi:hypothetical protein